jgi:hypothetical protein
MRPNRFDTLTLGAAVLFALALLTSCGSTTIVIRKQTLTRTLPPPPTLTIKRVTATREAG